MTAYAADSVERHSDNDSICSRQCRKSYHTIFEGMNFDFLWWNQKFMTYIILQTKSMRILFSNTRNSNIKHKNSRKIGSFSENRTSVSADTFPMGLAWMAARSWSRLLSRSQAIFSIWRRSSRPTTVTVIWGGSGVRAGCTLIGSERSTSLVPCSWNGMTS